MRIYEAVNFLEDQKFECTKCMTRDYYEYGYESIGSDGQPLMAAVHGD